MFQIILVTAPPTPMDWLTFLSRVIESIGGIIEAFAWPVGLLLVVLLLKDRVIEMMPFIRRLKLGSLDVELDQEVQKLTRAAKNELPAPLKDDPRSAIWPQIKALAVTEPNQAVMQAWVEIERELIDFARTVNLDAAPAVWTMPHVLAALLYQKDKLSESHSSLIRDAKLLRDRVAHGSAGKVSAEEAIKYVDVAERIVGALPMALSSIRPSLADDEQPPEAGPGIKKGGDVPPAKSGGEAVSDANSARSEPPHE